MNSLLGRFSNFVLASRRNAIMMALLWSFVPLMSWVSAVVVALVTLRKGWLEGSWILVLVAIPAVAIYAAGYPEVFYYNFLGGNCITFACALLLRETGQWRYTLEGAAFLAILAVLIVHLVNPQIQSYWFNLFQSYYREANQAVPLKITDASLQTVFLMWSKMATGIQASILLFIALTNLVIARWLQSLLFNPGGLFKELIGIRLDLIASFAFIAIIILKYWDINVAHDAMPIMLFIFVIAGLSLVHWLVSYWKLSWMWFLVFYGIFFLLIQIVMWIVASIGVFDSIANFRRRLSAPKIVS